MKKTFRRKFNGPPPRVIHCPEQVLQTKRDGQWAYVQTDRSGSIKALTRKGWVLFGEELDQGEEGSARRELVEIGREGWELAAGQYGVDHEGMSDSDLVAAILKATGHEDPEVLKVVENLSELLHNADREGFSDEDLDKCKALVKQLGWGETHPVFAAIDEFEKVRKEEVERQAILDAKAEEAAQAAEAKAEAAQAEAQAAQAAAEKAAQEADGWVTAAAVAVDSLTVTELDAELDAGKWDDHLATLKAAENVRESGPRKTAIAFIEVRERHVGKLQAAGSEE